MEDDGGVVVVTAVDALLGEEAVELVVEPGGGEDAVGVRGLAEVVADAAAALVLPPFEAGEVEVGLAQGGDDVTLVELEVEERAVLEGRGVPGGGRHLGAVWGLAVVGAAEDEGAGKGVGGGLEAELAALLAEVAFGVVGRWWDLEVVEADGGLVVLVEVSGD